MALFIYSSPRLLSCSPLVHTLSRSAPPPASIIRGFSAADPSEPSATLDDPSSSSKSSSSGQGFGSSSSISSAKPNLGTSSTKKKQKGKERERESIIRRSPIENPRFVSPQEGAQAQEVLKNESAFLLGWLGLGGIILVEGLALAASGFLPEAWDKLLVKYLYPSFTPTVFLFVAGTVSYGVFKYLQNEGLKK